MNDQNSDENSAMQVDQQNESEYEEVLVYVDFPDFHRLNLLNNDTKIQLSDLAGPEPKCKINDSVNFSGEHQTNLGTQLFFQKDQKGNIEYYDKTISCLKFQFQSIDVTETEVKE